VQCAARSGQPQATATFRGRALWPANALHLPSTLGSLCGSRNQIEGANLNPTRLVSQHFTWLIGIKNMNQSSARETFRETGIDTGLKSVLRFIPPSDVI
jgi:hypothetical protein